MSASTNGLLPLTTPPYPGLDLNADQAPRVIATCVILMVISTIAVALRFLARHLSQAGLWWDDWTILASMVVSYGASICMLIALRNGFGRHIAALGNIFQRIDAGEKWFKLFYAYEIIYAISILLAKYSILLFYSRIFKERPFRIALYGTFFFVTVDFIGIFIPILAECVPITALWDFTQQGHCINLNAFFLGSGIPNIIINAWILCLPLPMIWSLDITRKHKIALSSVFLLGGFVVIVSIIRIVYIAQLPQVDITWVFVDSALWTSVEPAVAVCSACLPILRSLWIWNRRKSTLKQSEHSLTSPSPANRHNEHSSRKASFKKGGSSEKAGHRRHHRHGDSDQSRYPLNELPAGDIERGWANAAASTPLPPGSSNTDAYSSYSGNKKIFEKTALEHPLPAMVKPDYLKMAAASSYGSSSDHKHLYSRESLPPPPPPPPPSDAQHEKRSLSHSASGEDFDSVYSRSKELPIQKDSDTPPLPPLPPSRHGEGSTSRGRGGGATGSFLLNKDQTEPAELYGD